MATNALKEFGQPRRDLTTIGTHYRSRQASTRTPTLTAMGNALVGMGTSSTVRFHPNDPSHTETGANPVKDFTPTKETISLHGLGFIQLVLGGRQRMHVWHPDLPRRDCYEHSAVHNHRFDFHSLVLKGVQINQRCELEIVKPGEGTHQLISHNGPRSDKGGRLSYPVADVNVYMEDVETYKPGDEYHMPAYGYHHTPCEGIVVTLLTKYDEGTIHANSVCARGVDFHFDFDRFQLSPEQLYAYVVDALKS